MLRTIDHAENLRILREPVRLDLSVNELRLMVGCFRAVAYFMRLDDEPYLDLDALELKKKLEQKYENSLSRTENSSAS